MASLPCLLPPREGSTQWCAEKLALVESRLAALEADSVAVKLDAKFARRRQGGEAQVAERLLEIEASVARLRSIKYLDLIIFICIFICLANFVVGRG